MTVSVCMCTCNGERYIEKQMASILEQTAGADEVIICDDVSTDRTVELIEAFIRENHLEEGWKLYRNEEKKGYPANFYYAMGLCKGEAVFLSDQDDVWHKEKIARMREILAEHEECKVVCCKFDLIDGQDREIHSIMSPVRSRRRKRGGRLPADRGQTPAGAADRELRRVGIKDVFYKCEWPGMVLAYRNPWYQERMRGMERSGWEARRTRIPHDFLICAWAAEENGFLQMDAHLACHRRHGHNAGREEHRILRLLDKKRKLEEIRVYLDILSDFDRDEALRTVEGREALRQKNHSMEGRYEALESGKVGEVVRNAGKDRGNVRLATLICDVIITIGNRK